MNRVPDDIERLKLDQGARAALLKHYGSLLRSWSAVPVATAIAFFGIIISDRQGTYLNPVALAIPSACALSFLGAIALYAFTRMIWHGKLAEHVLFVRPLVGWDEAYSYMHHLDSQAKSDFENEWGVKYRFLDNTGDFTGAVCLTGAIGIALFVSILLHSFVFHVWI